MSGFSAELIDYLEGRISFEEFDKRREEREAKQSGIGASGLVEVGDADEEPSTSEQSLGRKVKQLTADNSVEWLNPLVQHRPFTYFLSNGARHEIVKTKRDTYSHSFCSVPLCTNSKRKQPYLSFHDFPGDAKLRRKWLTAIRRDEGRTFTVRRGSTFVCSQHFHSDDFQVSLTGGIVRRLNSGVVPSRFPWSVPPEPSSSGFETAKAPLVVGDVQDSEAADASLKDNGSDLPTAEVHVCTHPSSTGSPGAAAERTTELEVSVQRPPPSTQDALVINQFCATDDDYRVYTRFPSERAFRAFWRSIEPSAARLAYWTEARGTRDDEAGPGDRPLIDEFFMYCLRVAAGLKEKVLADIFGVGVSAVSRVIVTWANYLYLVLGSLPVWKSRTQVAESMPARCKKYCPSVRVILGRTEIRCESPSSLTLRSETTSTFKALIGVAPDGAITFASKLHAGSVSDGELTRVSGILDLLEPGDRVMTDRDFLIGEDALADVGARLGVLPRKTLPPLGKKDTVLAHLRITAERVIRRVKEYRVWDSAVPLGLAGAVDQMWASCCMMANYQGSV